MGKPNGWKKQPRRGGKSRLVGRQGRRLVIEGLEERQLLSASPVHPELMYYLKPVVSGTGVGTAPIVSSTGDYQGGGTAGTAHGNPFTVVLDQSAMSGQTVKMELYASIFGTDSDPTNDGYLTGALDILNRPNYTPLVGKPSQISLLPEFKGYGYSRGKVQGDLGTDGGPDLGGPLNVNATPDNNGSWVIPRATSPVFGTEFNDNDWVDIKLGTFTFTIGDNLASGASAQLSTERVVYSGWQPIHHFQADNTDAREEIGSNGGNVLTGPAVTIVMAGEPDSGTNSTETTQTTTETVTEDPDPIAAILARETPDPHPTGDQPTDSAHAVTLTAYTSAPLFPDMGIPELQQLNAGLEQIYANVLKNPDARPSYWGEVLTTGGGEYRLHFNDNGMLISSWTVSWGDGSDPEIVFNRPWIVHQYPGGAGQYQITVTAKSVNGTYSGGAGGSTGGALSQDFSATSDLTDSMRMGGPEPNWVDPIGNGGKTTTNFVDPPGWDEASAIALDNGNILVIGTTGDQFGLVRYVDQPGSANDGEPDTNFGVNGLVTTAFTEGAATASAVAVDGNTATIVVAGTVLDTSGHKRVALARYGDADGDPDMAFNSTGTITTDLGTGWEGTSAVVVQSDGSILVAGSLSGHFALLHYTSNGTRDTSYGGATDGIVTVDFGGTNEISSAMVLDQSGRILLAGTSTQSTTGKDFALARLLTNGTLDPDFATGGKVSTNFTGGDDEASAIAVQPSDGKIVLAGYSDDGNGYKVFALARYDTSGNPDTFGTSGKATIDFGDGSDRATGVKVQFDGRIVVSGSTLLDGSGNVDVVDHFALARFNPNGTPDSSFGEGEVSPAGTVTSDFFNLGFTSDSATSLILDTTGRLVMAGTATADTYSSLAVACFDPGESSISVEASDIPPVLRVVGDQFTNQGQSLDLPELGTFTHSSVTGDFNYQINWGDGSTPATGTATIMAQGSASEPLVGSFGSQHTYALSGVYYVAATITDPDGGSDTQTFLVMVNATPTILTTAIPDGTVNVGQSYTLPAVSFSDSSLLDQHRATIDWGDGTADDAYLSEPYFDDSQFVALPGTLTNNHAYSESGDYSCTITLMDAGGATVTQGFTVHVKAADVALTDFSTDGHLFQVAYSVSNDSSAPFQIGIYSSLDGITPDQLLGSYPVGTVDANELIAGPHAVSITPPTADVPGDYYLIAVADSDLTPDDDTRAFSGGIFRADNGTVYVFGSDVGDTAGVQPSSLTLNDASYILTATPTTVHIRTEGGNDAVTVDTGVTAPLEIYGGSGNDIITDGGSGSDLVDGGDGRNTLNGGYGFNLPEIVDDTDSYAAGRAAYYQESGSGWSSETTGFNQTERLIAAASTAQATWTFTGLPDAVYDVYVTWSPQGSAATGAAYVVKDNATSVNPVGQGSVAPVDQTFAPADDQAAGVSWHHLGAFEIASGILKVQLGADATHSVMADAVRLVQHTETPATNLDLDSFSISTDGVISVQYTVTGSTATPFTIGIYGSPDGSTPGTLLQTIEVDDPSLLTGGTSHAATIDAALGQLGETDYILAKLDITSAVYQQSRADDMSTPFSGIFQQVDGAVYVVGNATSFVNDHITITQNQTTGNIAVSVTEANGTSITSQSFSGATSVTIDTPGGGNTITVDSGVTVPVTVNGGSGDTVTGPTANEVAIRLDGSPTIYEGQGVSVTLLAALSYGSISNWYINWGDGSSSTNDVSHQYTYGTGTYTVSATAIDTNGISYNCPDTISVGVLPNAPGGLSATAISDTGGQIQLSWSNASQIATGFRLEQSTDGSNYTLLADVGGYTSTYLVTGLTASTNYYFRICAVNNAGRSAYVSTTGTTNEIPGGDVPGNDDDSSQLVDIGMKLNFYGTQFSQVYINNNGNLTTKSPMGIYTPSSALQTGYASYGAIIAPFFGDVDTRNSHGTVKYVAITVDDKPAWRVNWSSVDYYDVTTSGHNAKYDTFSVTLVDRSDIQAGDFDIIFHYDTLQWETGDAYSSGGHDGLAGTSGVPARQGWSNGSGETGTYFEDLQVSGHAGGYEDSLSGSGDHKYEIRNPTVGITAYRTGGNYGAAVSEDDQRSGDPSNYVILVNDNSENDPDGTTDIEYNTALSAQHGPVNTGDHDLAHITLTQLVSPSPPGRTLQGTISLVLSNSSSARVYDASGNLLTDLTATIGGSGYLAGLASGDVDIYVEGLQADPDFSLTYNYVDSAGRTEATASVHMAIADISFVDIYGDPLSRLLCINTVSGLQRGLDVGPDLFKARIDGLHSSQIQQVTLTSEAGAQGYDQLTDRIMGAESNWFWALADDGDSGGVSIQNLNVLAAPDDGRTVTVAFQAAKDQQTQEVAVTKTAIEYEFPFEKTSSWAKKSVISWVESDPKQRVLHVKMRKGPEYGRSTFLEDITGVGEGKQDSDSAQFAVRWYDGQGNAITGVVGSNAVSQQKGRKEAALWKQSRDGTAYWDLDIPQGAVRVEIVLVYTDGLYAPPDNFKYPCPANSTQLGDVPFVIGYWTGELTNGNWEYKRHPNKTSQYLGHWPTPQELRAITTGAIDFVKDRTGYELVERPVEARAAVKAYLDEYIANGNNNPDLLATLRKGIRAIIKKATKINGPGDTGFDIVPKAKDEGYQQ